jgi:preprotein translocase subunit SecE
VAKSRSAAKKRGNLVTRYFRETFTELRKVNWPTRPEAMQLTMIVIIVLVLMSSLLGFLDFLFARVVGFIIGLG